MRRARCLVLSAALATLLLPAAAAGETVIPAADPPVVHAFAVEGAGAGSVFYLRLSLKPSVGAAVSLPEGDEGELPGAALSTYLRVGEEGEILTLDGDGSGGGTWLATGYVTPLDIDGGGNPWSGSTWPTGSTSRPAATTYFSAVS